MPRASHREIGPWRNKTGSGAVRQIDLFEMTDQQGDDGMASDIARMRSPDPPAILIVIGVSGSGKTTVATALAQQLGWPLQEGDELYPPVFAKIRSTHPLDVRDQWSWLAKVAA